MGRRRDVWFEFSWLGGWYPSSWEGLLVLVAGVGGFLGLTSAAVEVSKRLPGSDLVLIPVGLAFLTASVCFVLMITHTRTRRQAREEAANTEARRLFRPPSA